MTTGTESTTTRLEQPALFCGAEPNRLECLGCGELIDLRQSVELPFGRLGRCCTALAVAGAPRVLEGDDAIEADLGALVQAMRHLDARTALRLAGEAQR